MPDLQLANAGTVETKTGFLVPPLTINVPGWDDLTQKDIRLEIFSEHGTLLFELTDNEPQLDVTPAQVAISPEASPIQSDTAKAGSSTAKYDAWGALPAGRHKAVLRFLGQGQTDATIGLSFDLRHRTRHDTAPVATSLVTSLTVEDSGGSQVDVTIIVGGLTVAGIQALPAIAAVDPSSDLLILFDADGAVVGTASPDDLGIGGGGLGPIAAQSVLANATDASAVPVALQMAASTILARLAAGNVKAATPEEIKTLLALAFADLAGSITDAQLPQSAVVQHEAALSLAGMIGYGLLALLDGDQHFTGRIGVGMAPTKAFEVKSAGADDAMRFIRSSDAAAIFWMLQEGADGRLLVGAAQQIDLNAAGAVAFKNKTSFQVDIDASGTPAIHVNNQQQVGFGTSSPDGAALVEFTSTTRGVLFPRMTTAQRDAIAAVAGLTIFNTTTSKLETYDGAVWQPHW